MTIERGYEIYASILKAFNGVLDSFFCTYSENIENVYFIHIYIYMCVFIYIMDYCGCIFVARFFYFILFIYLFK